ncbi:TetR/AcrR family transcriptional regulator [Amycolatopsis sp. NPDC059021]|uniref:TetR/AcrR family transcriptional regulator n=1 Tax=Amycolatopsis sp. NPDC059021 TaxID=3346704 RepID=UPI0036705606
MTVKPPWMTPPGVHTARTRRMSAARREELLRQLAGLVLAEGFARLTVDDLASRLQCSKSTLYAVAASKEQLVVLAVRHFFTESAARVSEKVAPITDPSQRIAAYLAGLGAEMRRMSPECYADMVTTQATAEIYARNSLAAAQHVRESIQDGVASGEFRAVNADFVGAAVSLLIDSIQHGELLDRTGLAMGDAYTELGNLVLAALTNHTGAP